LQEEAILPCTELRNVFRYLRSANTDREVAASKKDCLAQFGGWGRIIRALMDLYSASFVFLNRKG
jgi:hypothetical protein